MAGAPRKASTGPAFPRHSVNIARENLSICARYDFKNTHKIFFLHLELVSVTILPKAGHLLVDFDFQVSLTVLFFVFSIKYFDY